MSLRRILAEENLLPVPKPVEARGMGPEDVKAGKSYWIYDGREDQRATFKGWRLTNQGPLMLFQGEESGWAAFMHNGTMSVGVGADARPLQILREAR